jgi:hypothetical protein
VEEAPEWRRRIDELPNLQLLTAGENTAKGDLAPVVWASTQLEAATREMRLAEGDLDPLPESLAEFFDWFDNRRKLQEVRLRKLLTVEAAQS